MAESDFLEKEFGEPRNVTLFFSARCTYFSQRFFRLSIYLMSSQHVRTPYNKISRCSDQVGPDSHWPVLRDPHWPVLTCFLSQWLRLGCMLITLMVLPEKSFASLHCLLDSGGLLCSFPKESTLLLIVGWEQEKFCMWMCVSVCAREAQRVCFLVEMKQNLWEGTVFAPAWHCA